MNWVTLGGLARTAVNGQGMILAVNSIFQPSAVDTHQPLFHDTWNTMYDHYRVYKVKYSIVFDVNGLDNTTEHLFYVYPHDLSYALLPNTTATNAQVESFCEQYGKTPGVKYRFINNYDKSQPRTFRFKGMLNLQKLCPNFYDSNRSANFGANPSDIYYLNLGYTSFDGNTYTDSVDVRIRLKFYVKLMHADAAVQQ